MAVIAGTKGQIVNLPPGWDRDTDDAQLAESCADGNGTGIVGGFWACSTHREAFQTNMEASGHEERGKHVSYWYCHAHGPEEA